MVSLPITHTIHKAHGHYGWDNTFKPVLTVAPGESITFETRDATDGQLTAQSTAADIAKVEVHRVNPCTGPIFVDGAEPGDALKVTVLGFQPARWGFTANIPTMGILTDQFPDPVLHHWTLENLTTPMMYGPGARVPVRPFAGVMGVAPAAPGHHSIIPPRRVGGNMDVRDISEGTELWLPVEVAGALFSVGDTHAAQGDGEVCGTAIETSLGVSLKFDLVKQANLKFPRYRTAGPISRHIDSKGFDVTTGIGPDLMQGARDAVSGMVDLLSKEHKMKPVEAYMLLSVCADLHISCIVDKPNWIVTCYFPRQVLE